MTTKIMLAQKQGDTAQPLYPKTSTRAVFMEETSGATLRESLLELESASFPDFSGLVTRVETLEKYAPPSHGAWRKNGTGNRKCVRLPDGRHVTALYQGERVLLSG